MQSKTRASATDYTRAESPKIGYGPSNEIDMIKNTPVFLHIGCANVKKEGFINIDTRPTVATDIVADAWQLGMFPDNSVKHIYTRHMIEHLEPDDAVKSIREWYRVLSTEGTIQIICPDLAFHARQLLGMSASTIVADQRRHAMAGFYGWREESRGGSRFDAHRWGYTFDSLAVELSSAGFVAIARVVSGPDSEAWHLNVRASKRQSTDTGPRTEVSPQDGQA